MSHKCRTMTIAVVTAVVLLAVPSAGMAQATDATGDTGTTGELQYPRNNVKGGALGARSPGNWLNRAAGNHVDRQTTMLKNFGGATPMSEDQLDPPRHRVMTLAFLQGLFDFLTQLVDQYQLAIQASKLASTST